MSYRQLEHALAISASYVLTTKPSTGVLGLDVHPSRCADRFLIGEYWSVKSENNKAREL